MTEAVNGAHEYKKNIHLSTYINVNMRQEVIISSGTAEFPVRSICTLMSV